MLAAAAATVLGTLAVTGLAPVGPGVPVAVAATDAPTQAPTQDPTPGPPSPTSCTLPACLPRPTSPPPSPTPSATAAPSATPSPTASPTPRRTRARASAKPRATSTDAPLSNAPAVTNDVPVGPVTGLLDTPSPTTTPLAKAKEAAGTSRFADLGGLVRLVLVVAVLLGLGGATGLYLTRHRHEH